MIRYTVYEATTGRIIKFGVCQEEAFDLQEQEGQATMVGNPVDLSSQYVVNGQFIDREKNPARLSGAKLTDVPVPSSILLEGIAYEVTESTVDLDISVVGDYLVTVQSFPYLDASFTVTIAEKL